MNKLCKNTYAFTLMEIVLVLIILGVIIAMTFSGIYAQVERNRAQEALNSLNLIRASMESCGIQYNYDYSLCNSWGNIGMSDPSNNSTGIGNFNYNFLGSSFVANSVPTLGTNLNPGIGIYTIQANRTGSLAGNTVTISRLNTGSVLCKAIGLYSEFC